MKKALLLLVLSLLACNITRSVPTSVLATQTVEVIPTEAPPVTSTVEFVASPVPSATLISLIQMITLRGLARPSLEWYRTEWGFENITKSDFELMASWGANIIRLPLNQRSWLEKDEYKAQVRVIVSWILEIGMHVMLDLHWSEKGDPNLPDDQVGQHKMPDLRSLEFWIQIAQMYGNDEAIIFELYNEPHSVDPKVWANGGMVDGEYQAVGMQQLANAIRQQGAQNWLVVNGLDWGFDHSKLPRIEDARVIYGGHFYESHESKNDPEDWDRGLGFLAADEPIMISEFGDDEIPCNGEFEQQVIDWAEEHNASWVAWAWYPEAEACDFPSLIGDWNGTPTPSGEVVRQNLLALNR